MHSKNDLQEYCQKHGYASPRYQTKVVGGEPHNPVWQSMVTMHNGREYRGETSHSKRDAEKLAAMAVTIADSSRPSNNICDRMTQIMGPLSTDSPTIYSNFSRNHVIPSLPSPTSREETQLRRENPPVVCATVAILIDLENQPDAIDHLVNSIQSHYVEILVFASSTHPSLRNANDFSLRITVCPIPSKKKDAADIGMTMMVGNFMANNTYEAYIIVTRDHFGETLAECISNMKFSDEPVRGHWCKNANEVIDLISTSSSNRWTTVEPRDTKRRITNW